MQIGFFQFVTESIKIPLFILLTMYKAGDQLRVMRGVEMRDFRQIKKYEINIFREGESIFIEESNRILALIRVQMSL